MNNKKWFTFVLLVTMILFNVSVNAEEQVEEQVIESDFEMDGNIIRALVNKYTSLGESIALYRKTEMSWGIDDLYWLSNDAFFLLLYDMIYNESFEYKSAPLQFGEEFDEEDIPKNILYNMEMEKNIRKQRMVDDGYLLQEELELYPITKENLAIILYRIYKDVLPFEDSVSYVDTRSLAVRWAAERSIPFFLNPSGYEIYPNQSLHNPTQYTECLMYAYLYFPNPITGQYSDVIISEEKDQFVLLTDKKLKVKDIVSYINHIRDEVKKPRLGYWVKDVFNDSEISTSASMYMNSLKRRDLIELNSKLKEHYNLLPYQDDLDYIGFMCKLFDMAK